MNRSRVRDTRRRLGGGCLSYEAESVGVGVQQTQATDVAGNVTYNHPTAPLSPFVLALLQCELPRGPVHSAHESASAAGGRKRTPAAELLLHCGCLPFSATTLFGPAASRKINKNVVSNCATCLPAHVAVCSGKAWVLHLHRRDFVEDPYPRMPKISYEANRRAKAEMRVCGASGGGVVEIRVCVLEEVG